MTVSSESVLDLLRHLADSYKICCDASVQRLAFEKEHNQRRSAVKIPMLCFQAILFHRGREDSNGKTLTVYDQLLACCHEKWNLGKDEEADYLNTCVTKLMHLPNSDNLQSECLNVLKLLLALRNDSLSNDDYTNTIMLSKRATLTSCRKLEKEYQHFPRQLFEQTNDDDHKTIYGSFNSKLFELCPGFASENVTLSCQRYPSAISDFIAPTLYGALTRPLKNAWNLNTRLEFPELLDDSPSPRIPELYQLLEDDGKATLKSSEIHVDEDEGFVETDTPSSAGSNGISYTNDYDVWDDVIKTIGDKPSIRYATWETLGCYYVSPEKPLLSEAGSKALDEAIACMHYEMSIIHPELSQILHKDIIVSSKELFRDIFNVLIGVSSRTFFYNEAEDSFVLNSVTASGISVESTSSVLQEFASSGTAYFRLHRWLKSNIAASVVQQGLMTGVNNYLVRYCSAVLDLSERQSKESSQLLNLLEKTVVFRRQIRLLLHLCFLDDDSLKSSSSNLKTLPRGVGLLEHLYNAAQLNADYEEDQLMFIALLLVACKPYIRFLFLWAVEGRLDDPHHEFPICDNVDVLQLRDERFWKDGFYLKESSDPLLGYLLKDILICGKSVRLLRICCVKHFLFQYSAKLPNVTVAFVESKQRDIHRQSNDYFGVMMSELDRFSTKRGRLHQQQFAVNQVDRLIEHITKPESLNQKTSTDARLQENEDIALTVGLNLENNETRVNVGSYRNSACSDLMSQSSDTVSDTAWTNNISTGQTVEPSEVVNASSIFADAASVIVSPSKELPFFDANMNLMEALTVDNEILANTTVDTNANTCKVELQLQDLTSEVPEMKVTQDSNEQCGLKGIKRKQDRDSIDFDAGRLSSRIPKRDVSEVQNGQPCSEESLPDKQTRSSKMTDLVVGNTFTLLRSRGRSAHGHSSDSTIQKLMYGDVNRNSSPVKESPKDKSEKDTTVVEKDTNESSKNSSASPSSPFANKTSPYTSEFSTLDELPMADIFKQNSFALYEGDEFSAADVLRFPLAVVFKNCLAQPFLSQIRCVDLCLLDYFLGNLKAMEHLSALRDYFFLQDGIFAQTLSDLLFNQLSVSTIPTKLLNSVVLNSILFQSLAHSHAPNEFSDRLGFSVKYTPTVLLQNTPGTLNCLSLCYKVDWPLNILITSNHLVIYERIFSFVLQIRRCSWALVDTFSTLKELDSKHRLASSRHFCLLQLFRHEMFHFVRSLYEYVSVEAFQVTWLKFQGDSRQACNVEQLSEMHSKYLRQICFRCLLHKKAGTIMNVVQDLFAAVLKFHHQVKSFKWKLNADNKCMELENFHQLCLSFKVFQDHSFYLFKVISKLVQRGYQTHLMEFLLRLDIDQHYYKVSDDQHVSLSEHSGQSCSF